MKTPVLFETFARPEYARQVFNQIKKAKPSKFYFYSNKARKDHPEEIEKNEEIRSWVKEVDWECELHTFFREEYVEIYPSLQGSKDWVFKNEECAIILEEDCVPSLAFFEFVDKYIDLYRNNPNIAYITGDNYVNNFHEIGSDHFVTAAVHLYGIATWRYIWQSIDFNIDIKEFVNSGKIEEYYPDKERRVYWKNFFLDINQFLIDTKCWDYMFAINCMEKKQYGIAPSLNLIHNIGVSGVHVKETNFTHKECIALDSHFPFANNTKISLQPNNDYDISVFKLLKKSTEKTYTTKIKEIIKIIIGETYYQKLKRFYKSHIK